MSDNRKFKGIWIPASLWLDKSLSITEKIVLCEIDSYDNEFRCVASNSTLCRNLNISSKSISNVIQSLQKKGAIDITFSDYNSLSGRKISVTYQPLLSQRPPIETKAETPPQNMDPPSINYGGPPQNMAHSNTFSNNSSISTNVDTEHSTTGKIKEVQAELFNGSSQKIKERKKSDRQKIVDFFHDFYFHEKSTKYKFQEKDFGNIKNLTNAIKGKLIEEGNLHPSSDDIVEATQFFISASYKNGNDWFKDNFTLSLVYSQFNQSFSKLKNGINGNSKKSNFESERDKIEQLFS